VSFISTGLIVNPSLKYCLIVYEVIQTSLIVLGPFFGHLGEMGCFNIYIVSTRARVWVHVQAFEYGARVAS
jgi:hypothetical protein